MRTGLLLLLCATLGVALWLGLSSNASNPVTLPSAEDVDPQQSHNPDFKTDAIQIDSDQGVSVQRKELDTAPTLTNTDSPDEAVPSSQKIVIQGVVSPPCRATISLVGASGRIGETSLADAHGHFSIDSPSLPVRVWAQSPGKLPNFASVRDRSGAKGVSITLREGSIIRGRLLPGTITQNTSRQKVTASISKNTASDWVNEAGSNLNLRGTRMMYLKYYSDLVVATTVTDSDGRFEFLGLPDCAIELSVEDSGQSSSMKCENRLSYEWVDFRLN
ncbi:MAG: hypothetical protein KDC95_09855 [Planctomycetes bacterium]|nr:hypothetical protein [Planctomycetota bacterium]